MAYNNFTVVEDNVNGIANLKVVEFNYNGQNVRNLVYIPDDVSEDTKVFMYAHGADDGYVGSPSFKPICDMLQQNGSDSIVVMALHQYTYANEPTGHEMNYFLSVLKDNFNVNTDKAMYAGFSSGGPSALVAAMDMKRENPSSKPVVALIDSIYYNGLISDPENLSLLSGVTILDLYNNFNKASDAKLLAQNGVNIVRAFNGNGHVDVNVNFFNNGLIDSFNGNLDSLNGDYQFQKFDPDSGEWVNIIKDEVYELINNGDILVDNPYRYYDKLSNLGDLQCNNEFIASKINTIRGNIKNTNFLSSKGNDSYGSTTMIPNAEADIIQTYFTSCASLLNDIEKDTVKIVEIGNSYKDINESLKREAVQLNDSVNNNTNLTNTIYTEQSNNTGYIPSGGIIGTVPSVGSIGSFGSSSSNEINVDNVSTNTNDPLGYTNLSSNDKQIVYDKGDYYIVVKYDGDKVIGLEYYFDFKHKDIAISREIDLKYKYDNIEDIVREGQYVRVTFKDDAYKDLTLNDIKEQYKNLKEVVKESV